MKKRSTPLDNAQERQDAAGNSPDAQYEAAQQFPVQRKEAPNATGIPDGLKSKMEGAFGTNLDHVQLKANSSFPGKVGAIATAQGNRIDIAPGHYNPDTAEGQKLIGHEAWHTVQQAEGKVKPTMQMKSGHAINDDRGLEAEADKMGERVARGDVATTPIQRMQNNTSDRSTTVQPMVIQRAVLTGKHDVWKLTSKGKIRKAVDALVANMNKTQLQEELATLDALMEEYSDGFSESDEDLDSNMYYKKHSYFALAKSRVQLALAKSGGTTGSALAKKTTSAASTEEKKSKATPSSQADNWVAAQPTMVDMSTKTTKKKKRRRRKKKVVGTPASKAASGTETKSKAPSGAQFLSSIEVYGKVTPLLKKVSYGEKVKNVPTHVTFMAYDSIRNGTLAPIPSKYATIVSGLHITIEEFGQDSPNNPKYFLASGDFVKAESVSRPVKSWMKTEGARWIEAIRAALGMS